LVSKWSSYERNARVDAARSEVGAAITLDGRITELHSIMPIANITSVMARGILSYERAARLPHTSVALQPVQERRDCKRVPGGLQLHRYANLYFHARNPMLYKRLNEVNALCVLRIATGVLDLEGVVLSDQNAASDYARFVPPCDWPMLNFDDILAMDWRHPGDRVAYYRHKARKCAEVLVPHVVRPQFLLGAYVVDAAARAALTNAGFDLPITVNRAIFFR
jgi:hypothetical protein